VAVRRRPAWGAPGQHFLRSSRLAADLVEEAEVARSDLVVEVGGGTGMLTDALARTGARIVVLERDPALVAHLRARFAGAPHVEVVHADATRSEWPDQPFAVVANLPFEQSGAILAHLLRDPRVPLRRADVIVEWHVGAKHAAVWPSTLRSTYWRAWHDISVARRLARTSFAPPPHVDAAVLRFERRTVPRVPVDAHRAYWEFLAAAFAVRAPLRRALAPGLSSLQLKRLAPALGFGPDTLARDLDAGQWAALFTAGRR
jgi:23S rRNA (adenine-N6)-dimethyltransferase